jgi:hypothetical protein
MGMSFPAAYGYLREMGFTFNRGWLTTAHALWRATMARRR